ncbi:hypothetical protein RSJ42_16085 [Methanosarcina hadiensis]|uniref:hypothetical protein n=1 Tax=Methanosarcina hadiensis TaxID=3078083 RepID=UPI00397789CA
MLEAKYQANYQAKFFAGLQNQECESTHLESFIDGKTESKKDLKMKSKNEIQKRSPPLHVKCHKNASSGEAIRLDRLGQSVQGSYHLDILQLLRYTHVSYIPDLWVYPKATSER